MPAPSISHISDTAHWVAVYRAWETARPDALFRDPFAERLAGEQAKRFAESARQPLGSANGWPMIMRTKVIDDLVLASLADGCDCVLNLAAGLDTRPYRLALPRSLSWIEADLPGILDEKERALAGETPVCRLRRERIDLSDIGARSAFFDEVAKGAQKVLVLTEGLIVYLEDEAVRGLARDVAARATFRFWMVDLSSPAILKRMQKNLGHQMARAPLKFAPANGVAFFEPLGWAPREIRSLYREGVRHKRVPWPMRLFSFVPDPDPRNPGNKPWGAVVRFERRAG